MTVNRQDNLNLNLPVLGSHGHSSKDSAVVVQVNPMCSVSVRMQRLKWAEMARRNSYVISVVALESCSFIHTEVDIPPVVTTETIKDWS